MAIKALFIRASDRVANEPVAEVGYVYSVIPYLGEFHSRRVITLPIDNILRIDVQKNGFVIAFREPMTIMLQRGDRTEMEVTAYIEFLGTEPLAGAVTLVRHLSTELAETDIEVRYDGIVVDKEKNIMKKSY